MKNLRKIVCIVLVSSCALTLWGQDGRRQQLSLEDVFRLAETNSKSIRVSDFVSQEAEQGIKIAKNALLPSIDVSLSASYLGNGTLTDRDFSDWQKAPMPHFGNNFSVEASQVVYAGGAIRSGIELAKLQHQTAKLDKENNRQDVLFLLVGNYLEMCKLKNQEEVFVQNIDQTKRLIADIKAKESEGLALKNDITRYELQLKTIELALTQTQNGITIINNQLVTLLGLPSETIIDVDASLSGYLPSLISEGEWHTVAMNTSPSIQKAKLGIEQSKYNEKIVKAERLPSVALFASNRFDGPITIEVPAINKNFNYWYVGIGVKFNLASTYKSGKKVRQARLSTQRAIENESLLQDNIQIAVNAAYVRFKESFTVFDTQMKSLELAEQNYAVVNKRYMNDLALITDMLDASNSKLSAELQLTNARINILFNYYSLKKASGNL